MVLLMVVVGPAFDNSLVAVSKRLSVNPDLVSAARTHGHDAIAAPGASCTCYSDV